MSSKLFEKVPSTADELAAACKLILLANFLITASTVDTSR